MEDIIPHSATCELRRSSRASHRFDNLSYCRDEAAQQYILSSDGKDGSLSAVQAQDLKITN